MNELKMNMAGRSGTSQQHRSLAGRQTNIGFAAVRSMHSKASVTSSAANGRIGQDMRITLSAD
jgi:hypothetical protein